MLKRRLKEAYDNVFSKGNTTQHDVDVVLHDILSKSYVNKPIEGDNVIRAEKEGKRKLGLHIHNMLNLPIAYFLELDERVKEKDAKTQSKKKLI